MSVVFKICPAVVELKYIYLCLQFVYGKHTGERRRQVGVHWEWSRVSCYPTVMNPQELWPRCDDMNNSRWEISFGTVSAGQFVSVVPKSSARSV